ncbi:hypothetical protein GGI35DRAFT_443659 [Trichoderma velutinum]
MVAENWALDGPTIKIWLRGNVAPLFCSWYGAVLLALIVFNLKGLPSICMARTCHPSNTRVRNKRGHQVSPHIEDGSNADLVSEENTLESIERHPLFQPVVISTDAVQLEIDLNLYKSNPNIFSDLEISRIKLMGQIIAPAWPMDDMEIEYEGRDGKERKEKVEGRPALILGATHTSFKRELRPQVAYNIESRILGWDSRWIYVGSWLHNQASSKRKVYATSLSKYVIKKGSITVRPEQFFIECGWISTQEEHDFKEDEMTSDEKVLLWSEYDTQKERGINIVQTWKEAIVLMEQEYED